MFKRSSLTAGYSIQTSSVTINKVENIPSSPDEYILSEIEVGDIDIIQWDIIVKENNLKEYNEIRALIDNNELDIQFNIKSKLTTKNKFSGNGIEIDVKYQDTSPDQIELVIINKTLNYIDVKFIETLI